MLRKAVLALALVASVALVAGVEINAPSWYKCDPTTCTGDCFCASVAAPGGLTPEETPQFVLFTHDDAIDSNADKVVRAVSDGLKNSNGCPVPVTWFVTKYGTECDKVRGLYADHHEIATHTLTHPDLNSLSDSAAKKEIVDTRSWLNETCRIPLEDLTGFRSPFLINRPEIRKILSDAGFLYDSTINEHFPSDTSPDANHRLWPYTLDSGLVQDCSWIGPPGQVCTDTERYPAMWEVPMWDLQENPTNSEGAYTMDPEGDVYAYLLKNFKWSYEGNRAPFPLYIHAPWLTEEHIAATKEFIQHTLAMDDVYYVTMRQMLEWMKNPVPKSQMDAFLTCNRPGATTVKTAGGVVPIATPSPVPKPAGVPVPVPATKAPVPATKTPVAAAPAPATATAPAPAVAGATSGTPTTSTDTSSSGLSVGVIVGIAVGGAAAAALVVAAIVMLMKKPVAVAAAGAAAQAGVTAQVSTGAAGKVAAEV